MSDSQGVPGWGIQAGGMSSAHSENNMGPHCDVSKKHWGDEAGDRAQMHFEGSVLILGHRMLFSSDVITCEI